MNGSSSPFRESRLTRPHFLLLASLAASSLFATGCRSTPKKQYDALPASSSGGNPSLLPAANASREAAAQWFKPEPVVAVVGVDSAKKEVARLLVSSCRNPAGGAAPFHSRWEVDLATPFGMRPVRFTVSRYGVKVLVRGYLGEESTEFISTSAVPDEWMQAACANVEAPADVPVAATPEVVAAIGGWLAGFAPDCNAGVQPAASGTAGWICQPATPDVAGIHVALEKTRQAMISGWTRQPYLLARRVAIGINITTALQNSKGEADPRPALKNACAIIRRSLRPELPLVLDDQRVIDTFCGELAKPDEAKAMAVSVAAKIAGEVSSLRQIFENTSKTGTLTVSLPAADQANSTFLVTLKPEEDVVLGLAKFTQAMLIERQNAWRGVGAGDRRTGGGRRRAAAETPSFNIATDAAHDAGAILGYACWHPLFDGTHQRLLIAQELGLVTSPNQPACVGREGPGSGGIDDVTWTPQRYVAESITSDTEFLVTNGETKVLRLPTGTYSYIIQVLQQAASAIEDSAMPAAPIAEGKIEWLSAKPRPVIKESPAS